MSTPSGNSNNGNTHNSYKMTPPVLTKEYGYSNWRYNLSVWEVLTLLEEENQGFTVYLSLTSQDKQAARTRSVENLSSANGVKLTIEELDKLYIKGESSLVHEAYIKLEKFSRPHEMSIINHLISSNNLSDY